MAKVERRGRKKGRIVLCVYKDVEPLEFVGVFLNARHIEDALGIHNANVGKYLDLKINELHGFIVVEVDAGYSPIKEQSLREQGLDDAMARRVKNKLLKLTNETILGLSNEQIEQINKIVENASK